jgi:hypothetical protein
VLALGLYAATAAGQSYDISRVFKAAGKGVGAANARTGTARLANGAREHEAVTMLPVPFIANQGQLYKRVAYYAPTLGGTV